MEEVALVSSAGSDGVASSGIPGELFKCIQSVLMCTCFVCIDGIATISRLSVRDVDEPWACVLS